MAGVKTNASLSAKQSFEYLCRRAFAQCLEWQQVKSRQYASKSQPMMRPPRSTWRWPSNPSISRLKR